jgi:hypothetical protein
MSNEQIAGGMPQGNEPVKADWAAISEDFSEVEISPAQNTENQTGQADITNTDNADGETAPDSGLNNEENTENKEGEQENAEEANTEANTEAAKEGGEEGQESVSLELTADDITDAPKQYEDGTFSALAAEFGVDLPEESFEAFKENFVPKTELSKVREMTVESILSTLKPETAAALKLIEQGIPEEQVFAPTREIDSYLSLEDAELVRKDLELTEGWTQELIDAKIEELVENPKKLQLAASEIRIALSHQRKDIIETRNIALQTYEQKRQEAALAAKQQEFNQIKEALNNVSEFMGVPVSKEAKDVIIAKYANGMYDDVVSKADSKVAAIMYKQFGEKLTKLIQSKAAEKAKLETTKKLLNVPPVSGKAGQKVMPAVQTDSNWGAILEDFKG